MQILSVGTPASPPAARVKEEILTAESLDRVVRDYLSEDRDEIRRIGVQAFAGGAVLGAVGVLAGTVAGFPGCLASAALAVAGTVAWVRSGRFRSADPHDWMQAFSICLSQAALPAIVAKSGQPTIGLALAGVLAVACGAGAALFARRVGGPREQALQQFESRLQSAEEVTRLAEAARKTPGEVETHEAEVFVGGLRLERGKSV